MPVPNTQEIRKPLLEVFSNEAPRNLTQGEFLEIAAEVFGENLNSILPDDKNIFRDNVTQAKNYLVEHKLLTCPLKNTYMITNRGLNILALNPQIIDDAFLANMSNEKITQPEEFFREEIKENETEETPMNESEPVHETEILEVSEPEPEVVEIVSEKTEEENIMEETNEFSAEPEQSENFDDIDAKEEFLESETEEPSSSFEAEPDPDEQQREFNFDSESSFEAETEEAETETEEPETESENENFENEHENVDEEYAAEGDESEPEAENESETEDEDYEDEFFNENGIEEVLVKYNSYLADKILERVASIPQDKFEMLVLDLLSKMGYFAFQNARYTTEASGSEMIQGVILDNKTGGNPIYIQARKLSPDETVERSDIQDFIEALSDKGKKGIFATTASFSENAEIHAKNERIMLIDGKKLTALMIANNFCVSVEKIFEFKTIDTDTISEYEA